MGNGGGRWLSSVTPDREGSATPTTWPHRKLGNARRAFPTRVGDAHSFTAGTLQFSAPSYSIAETGTMATITVTRTHGAIGAVGVSYATSNGTATEPADYAATSGTLSWVGGETTAKTFTVTIADDAIYEGNKDVDLTLSAPTGGAVLGTAAAVLTILEDEPEPPGTLQFSAPTYSITETGPVATITVIRRLGAIGAVSVAYATSDGTAVAGSDYTAASGTLNWADGDSADKTFTVPIAKDAVKPEPDETINLTLSAPGGGAVLGTPFTAVLTISKNDGGIGIHSGLALGVDPGAEKTGLIGITVAKTGKFTGKLQLGTDKFTFTGALDAAGNLFFSKAPGTPTQTLKRKIGTPLTLAMQIDLAGGGDHSTGTIKDGATLLANITGGRAIYRKENPFPKAKIVPFTAVFDEPVAPMGVNAPHGMGFATVKFSATGVAKITGRLPDSTTTFTCSGAFWENDFLPIYVPFFKGAGALAGLAEFKILAGNADAADLLWFRPAGQKGFLDGWAGANHLTTDFHGSKYLVSKAAPACLPTLTANDADGNAELALSDGDLVPGLLRGVGIDLKTNKATVIIPPDNAIKQLTITSATGLFKGTFVHPNTSKTITLQGAIIQDQAAGFGYFLSTDATGNISSGGVSLAADEHPLTP